MRPMYFRVVVRQRRTDFTMQTHWRHKSITSHLVPLAFAAEVGYYPGREELSRSKKALSRDRVHSKSIYFVNQHRHMMLPLKPSGVSERN